MGLYPTHQVCSRCNKEKPIKDFGRRGGLFRGDMPRRDCKVCQRRRQHETYLKERAYYEECKARGDGYDRPGDGYILPDEVRIIFELVLNAVKWAKSMNQVKVKPFAMKRKVGSLEWLLGFDVIDFDVTEDGQARWTFGACRVILNNYGVDLPNDEMIKAKLIEWAAEIDMEIEWNAIPLKKGVQYGVGEACATGSGRDSSAIGQFEGW
jgi:hypothetical protein